MKNILFKQTGSFSLIGLIVVAVLISVMWFAYLRSSLDTAVKKGDKELQTLIQNDGLDTTSHITVLESTKKRIKGIEQMQLESEQRLLNDTLSQQY